MQSPPQPYLFMSYRSSEGAIAVQVARDLRKRGLFIWMDQLEGLLTAQNWVQGLEQAIDHAAAMIVMLSPAYQQSRYCRRELLRADSLGYPIFPILIEDSATRPLELQNIQHIDMTDWRDAAAYQATLTRLQDHISTTLALTPADPLDTTVQARAQDAQLARQLEEHVDTTRQKLAEAKPQKRSAKLRKTRLQEQLTQYEREYGLALQQMTVELSDVSRDRLNQLMEQIEARIDDIDADLQALQDIQ